METLIRFESQLRAEGICRPLGVFRAAGAIEDLPHVPVYARDALLESLAWFNRNLIVPRLRIKDRRAIFWFRSRATEYVRRIWDVVAVLREENVFVRLFTTTRPGKIVYADEYQIAAIPGQR